MRVLLVNTYYYPNMFGGAEHSVRLLATNLAKKHSCAVFSVDSSLKGLHRENIEGVDIYRSGSICFNFKARFNKQETIFCKVRNRISDLYNPIALAHFSKVLDEFKPDIIHTNGLRGIGPQIWKIAGDRKIKVVHTLRDYFAIDPLMRENIPTNMILSIWQNIWNKKSTYIDCVTAPSDFTLRKLKKYGFAVNKPSSSIPNAIPFQKEALVDNIEYSKRKDGKTRFVFAGTLVDFKGVLKLLEAFRELQKKQANVELCFCGDGPLSHLIHAETESNNAVRYCGKLDSKSMAKEFLNADVCVVPSLWEEPFGRVVVEAAYNGCALIVSNKGGIPEIIQKLGAGIVCDSSNVAQLSDAMCELCSKEKRDSQLEILKENVGYFSISNNVELFDDLYKKLLTVKLQ